MRRLTSLLLTLCMLISLAACTSGNTTPAPAPIENHGASENDSTPVETTKPASIETDEKLLTVEITLPASLYEGVDMSDFDVDAYTAENGFLNTTLNEDGSITIVMSKLRHNELLAETAESIKSSFDELINAEDTPYIKEISHNADFSIVDVKVVRSDYENSFDMTPFIISLTVAFYQAFLDMDLNCTVNIIDIDSGETINSTVYPDAIYE